MPNGGIPMHMRLSPSSSPAHVIVCRGAELQVFEEEAWRRGGEPACALTRAEGRAVARFLRYWLEDTGEDPITRDPAVDADYDF